jgi:hypothetical protein
MSAAKRVSIADAFEPVTVDLWGHEFHTVRPTRSVVQRADKLEEQMEQVTDTDALAGVLGDALDVMLKPCDGRRTSPSKLIGEKWQADQVTLPDVLDLTGRLNAGKHRVSIRDVFEPITVDLWGHEFETVRPTRSVALKQHELEKRLSATTDDEVKSTEAQVMLLGDALDIVLKPCDGRRTSPSKLIGEKWQADQVTPPEVFGLFDSIKDAQERQEQERPT